MGLDRYTRRFIAWIACVAILAASLAPSISHALAAADTSGSLWAEICSASGLRVVKLDNGSATDTSHSPAPAGLHFEDCPYCLTHANPVVLPPASVPVPQPVGASFPLPSLFYQSPRKLFAWAPAQSRAPPVHA